MKVFASAAILMSMPTMLTSAVTIRVPADQPTIQQAINVAASGDQILVSPGTYIEHINYQGKTTSVESTDGPGQTIIDGSNSGAVVRMQTQETRASVLTGFTIQHGDADFGAAITLTGASPTITGNIFFENAQSIGGF